MSAARARHGVFGTDYRAEELLLASFLAASMPVWIIVGLGISRLDRRGNLPEVNPGMGTPIRVRPMIDMESPLIKKGGVKYKMAEGWEAPEPVPTAAPPAGPVVSPHAKDDPNAIPSSGKPVYDGGAPPNPSAAPAASGEPGPVDDAGGGSGDPGTGGGSSVGQDGGTDTNPLRARALRIYHGRVQSFLHAGFHCPKLPEGANKCSPTATVTVSGLTVTGVSFHPCGVPEIDAAAQAAANAKQGQGIPTPPENYANDPAFQMTSSSVTYICR